MTPEKGREAAEMITANTGREYLVRVIFPSVVVRQLGVRPKCVEEIEADVVVPTGNFPMPEPKTLEQGCATTLVGALDPAVPSGSYLEDCMLAEPEAYAVDKVKAQQLWSLSEDLVKQRFKWYLTL